MVEASNPTAGEAEATPAGGPIFPCTIECPWKKFNMSDPAAAPEVFAAERSLWERLQRRHEAMRERRIFGRPLTAPPKGIFLSGLRHRFWFLVLLGLASAVAVSCTKEDTETGGSQTPAPPHPPSPEIEIRPEALWTTGPVPGMPDAWILPIGQRITPTAAQGSRRFGLPCAMPLGLQVHPQGRHLFLTNSGGGAALLLVLDVETGDILSSIRKNGYFLGLAFGPDGSEVYVSGGGRNVIEAYRFDPVLGTLEPMEDRTMSAPGFVTGIAASPDGSLLFAAVQEPEVVLGPHVIDFTIQMPGTFCVFDTRTGALVGRCPVGLDPYAVAVHPSGSEAYVSNEMDSTISVIDLSVPSEVRQRATVAVQKNPEGITVNKEGTRLYVANADEDSLSVVEIGTETPKVLGTIDLRSSLTEEYGSGPNAVAISSTGAVLYVAQAGQNKLAVIDIATGAHAGDIPTGWYPTAVTVGGTYEQGASRETLYVACGKGIGTPQEGEIDHIPGDIDIIPVPDEQELVRLSSLTAENNTLPARLFAIPEGSRNPIPVRKGDTTPIKHVFFVVRENKTYDYLLGAFQPTRPGSRRANGDPSRTIHDHDKLLPNLYALADRFATADNYYCNAEASNQGHQMLTASMVNTFVEKLVFTKERPIPMEFEMVFSPVAWPKKDYIFQNAIAHGVSLRDYGEAVGAGKDGLLFDSRWVHHGRHDPAWFWLLTRDVDKMAERIAEWESEGFSGENFPQLVFMLLPNDHTFGHDPLLPTPESMIADNDEATGIFVDWLSHSPYWNESVAFITEDDPQQGSDHVDPHRTILLVVSPWVKPGYVSPVRYSEANIYATIEHILGLPPMTIYDDLAQPMYDMFTFEKTDEPFRYIPRIWPREFNPPGTRAEERSAGMRFVEPDEAEGLLEVLRDIEEEREAAQRVSKRIERGAARLWNALTYAIEDTRADRRVGNLRGGDPATSLKEMVRYAKAGDSQAFFGCLDSSVGALVQRYQARREQLHATALPSDPLSELLLMFRDLEPRPTRQEITGATATVEVVYRDGLSAALHFVQEGGQWKFRLSRHLAPTVRVLDDSVAVLNTFNEVREGRGLGPVRLEK